LQDEEPLPILLTFTPAIVVLADDPRSAWVAETLRSSVRGILPYQATASQILATVEAVADGLVVIHPDIVDSLLVCLPSTPRSLDSSFSQALTPREIEVLSMLAEGLGNKTIARRLGISEHTVKFHVGSIFTKLNASSRTEAVTIGARQGLIML
jgi:DNA-binding NarL/FixJ family response regulator